MTIVYEAQKLGFFRTLCICKGTMIPLVLKSPMFYVLLAIHAVLLVISNIDYEDGNPVVKLPHMSLSAVGTVTALLTFFLVFYGSQSYSRLCMFYGHCVGIGGSVMDFTALVRNHFPSDHNVQWNAVRLMLASMHIQFYTLNVSDGGCAITDEEWRTMSKRNLLKRSEVETLKEYTGFSPFLPLVWALGEIEDALLPKGAGADAVPAKRYEVSDLLSNFRELTFAFRGHCGQISNWLKHPVPFPYFHVLTLLLVLDLLLISYALVVSKVTAWFLTAAIYVIVCVAFLGLREVAVAMSDPFGDDPIDFDLEKMLGGAYKNSVALLRDTRPSDGSDIGELTNPITVGLSQARFTVDSTGDGQPLAEHKPQRTKDSSTRTVTVDSAKGVDLPDGPTTGRSVSNAI